MKKFPVRAVLFDLDGTLVDSVPDLASAIDATMEALERPTCGEAAVRNWVGNGVEVLVERALRATDVPPSHPPLTDFTGERAALKDTALSTFMAVYARDNGVHSRLFPGVADGVNACHDAGFRLGCVTNKPRTFTIPLLEALGLATLFSVVVAGDDAPEKKPSPAPLYLAAKQLEIVPEACLFVGDSVHDVEAARRAGMAVVGVPYGYNHGQDIADAQPDIVLDTLAGLIDQLDLLSAD